MYEKTKVIGLDLWCSVVSRAHARCFKINLYLMWLSGHRDKNPHRFIAYESLLPSDKQDYRFTTLPRYPTLSM